MLQLGYGIAQFIEIFLGIWMFLWVAPKKREHSIWFKLILVAIYLVWGILCAWNVWMTFVSNSFVIVNSLVLSAWILLYLKSPYFTIFIWELFYNTTIALFKMLMLILEGVLEQKRLGEVNWGNRNLKEIIWCFIIYFIVFTPLYNFLKEMPYEALWCIISLRTKTHERSDLIRQPYYTTTNT